ncbi:(2Fe-2S)-binding protein [Salipiger sp. CCB-MM3]|uniref:(2Fe-2S)-binding protein n=1 Tax=Salipiger sp. CCB-MM3 TaxID=1792508 RepID=UPI00187DAB96|nr:(2Fe-2S)-binding protein [Salipiger sp. CCB-MM3]
MPRSIRPATPKRCAWRKADLGRAFIDRWFAPPPALLAPRGDTLVCRCEEISAEAIREAARLGAPGPNQIKTYLALRHGPLSGRMCATSVTEIMADETDARRPNWAICGFARPFARCALANWRSYLRAAPHSRPHWEITRCRRPLCPVSRAEKTKGDVAAIRPHLRPAFAHG